MKLYSLYRAIIYIFFADTSLLPSPMGHLGQSFFETLYQHGLQRAFFTFVLFAAGNPEYLCEIKTVQGLDKNVQALHNLLVEEPGSFTFRNY